MCVLFVKVVIVENSSDNTYNTHRHVVHTTQERVTSLGFGLNKCYSLHCGQHISEIFVEMKVKWHFVGLNYALQNFIRTEMHRQIRSNGQTKGKKDYSNAWHICETV